MNWSGKLPSVRTEINIKRRMGILFSEARDLSLMPQTRAPVILKLTEPITDPCLILRLLLNNRMIIALRKMVYPQLRRRTKLKLGMTKKN